MSTSQEILIDAKSSLAPGRKFDFMEKLPALLRFLGAAAVIIAMYSFLAKGWQNGNDVIRYVLMLGHTGALAAIGLASGHWLKESKGARLLLTLSLVAVPANFAILGAFIFSQTPALSATQYPSYLTWSVDSLQAALLTSGAALVVLIPVILLGFTVLARSMSKKLSLLFLLSNMALLLPLRDPQMIALLVLGLTLCTLMISYKVAFNQNAAKTREGATALGLQLLPLAVLGGRNLWLYSYDAFLLAVLVITAFLVLRQMSLCFSQDSRIAGFLNTLSLVPAVSVSFLLSDALDAFVFIPDVLVFPLSAVLSAVMVFDISRRSMNNVDFYRNVAVWGLVLSLFANLVVFNTWAGALVCIILGVAMLVFAYQVRQRTVLVGGTIVVMAGSIQLCYELVRYFDLGSWTALAVLGVISILLASTIESKGGHFRPCLHRWKRQLRQWE